MPGMDGHRAEPRPQRRRGRGDRGLLGDKRFAWDSYRRIIQMYCNVVLELDHHLFEDILEETNECKGAMLDTDLAAGDRRDVARLQADGGGAERQALPAGLARAALEGGGRGVLLIDERPRHHLQTVERHLRKPGARPSVQAMVFGNMGETSA